MCFCEHFQAVASSQPLSMISTRLLRKSGASVFSLPYMGGDSCGLLKLGVRNGKPPHIHNEWFSMAPLPSINPRRDNSR